MVLLHTFGGIAIADERGEPIPGALAQRRPIALVVVVAASGRHGVSRDKLAGILWPDASPARARHSLTQALYAARRALGVDDLFVIDGVVRLNAARIWTDVGAFVNAIVDGDIETAASLYTGPFLDGFQIAGRSDVDQWIAERRTSFEEEAVDCFDGLAERAEASGALADAATWRRRIVTTRPADTPRVARLIALLARMGHRAEAAQRVDQHEAMLRSLGFPVDPAFVRVAEALRTPRSEEAAIPERSVGAISGAPPARRRRRRVTALAASAVLTAVTVGGVTMHRLQRTAAPAVRQTLVVVPFDAAGVGRPMSYMGTAIAELLSPRLALDSLVRPIDAGAVLGRWHSRFSGGSSVPRDSLIALGVDMGAGQLVVGTVSGARARVVVEGTLLSLPRGAPVASATVEGPADSLTALAGGLAAKLLIAESGEDERLAARWRESFGALKRLVAGRLADGRGDYLTAAREYQAALVADSTLATAALRLAVAADRLGNAELEADAVARAWSYREALDDAGRAKLLAFAGSDYPRPSSTEAQWRAWTALASRDIRQSDGWLHLAARLFHEGDRLGRIGVADRAEAAAHRALAMDGTNHATLSLLRAIDARQHGADTDTPSSAATTLTAIRTLAMSGLWMGGNARATRHAIEALGERAGTIAEALDAVLARHSLTVNQGNAADALDATRRLHALRPDSHAYLRLRVLDALYGHGDTTAGNVAARELSATVDRASDGFPLERRRRAADGCVVAQWRLARRDTTGVRRIVAFLRGQENPGTSQPVSAAPAVCAELLDAAFAVVRGEGDAVRRLARLDSLSLTTAVAGDAAAYEHILIARLYRSLGHPDRALAAIRRRGFMLGWPRYLLTTWREERELASEVGDLAGALNAERALSALRADSEP